MMSDNTFCDQKEKVSSFPIISTIQYSRLKPQENETPSGLVTLDSVKCNKEDTFLQCFVEADDKESLLYCKGGGKYAKIM